MRTNYLHEILSHPQSLASPYCSPCLASPTCPTRLQHLFLNCDVGELCVCEKSVVIDTELYANRVNVSLSPVLMDAAAEAVVAGSGVAAGALEVTARIDTGATCHNFISERYRLGRKALCVAHVEGLSVVGLLTEVYYVNWESSICSLDRHRRY